MAGKKTSVIQVMIAGDARDLQKATRQGVSGFELLAGAAIAATKVIASAATAIAGFSIREFAKFDDAMTKSTAIMGDLSDAMRKDMSDAARQVALETTFAADQAAEAFFFLASAGLTAEQSIAALPQVAKFAQAGAFDLATATDLLTDAQSALGLVSDDTAENLQNLVRVSDVLAKANTVSNATIQEFSEALTEKAGVAMKQLGIDIEEGTAALAVFADQGVKGTKAGTLLNTTLEGLARTADENTEAYGKLGVAVFDNEGEMRNLADIIGDLEAAFDGMSTQARNAELRNLGFTRQARDGVLQLLGNSEALREYERELRNAAGTTEEIAGKQLQSFNAQLSLLKSGLSDVGIEIGAALAGPLGGFVSWFREQIPAIKAFVDEAIPQVEAFVNRAVAKFREFKDFYDENLAGPLADLLGRLKSLVGEGLDFVSEFRERAVKFLMDFATAVSDADSEGAGFVLGQAIGDLIEMGFDRFVDFGKIVAEWAAKQDWVAIGFAFSVHFGRFAKGLFMGLTHSLDEESGELEFDGSRVAAIVVMGLVSRIPFVRNMIAARAGIFGLPIIGGILTGIMRAARLFTVGLVPIISLLGRGLVSGIGMAFGGTTILNAIMSAVTGLRLLFTGQFGLFFAALGPRLVAGFMGFGSLIVGAVSNWWTMLVPSLKLWAFRIALWFTGPGLKLILGGLLKIIVGLVAFIFTWPGLLVAAAIAAFVVFISRFRRWNEGQGEEYGSLGARIVQFISQGVDKMKDWFRERFVGWFKDRWAAIDKWFTDQQGDYENIGSRIVEGIIKGVRKMASELVTAMVDTAMSAVRALERALGINSPSLVFAGIGENLMEGMSLGIDRSSMDAVGAMVDASRQISGVDFRAPEVPLSGVGSGGAVVNVTVNGAVDPEGTARQIRRILQDAERRSGVRVLS
jgi:TP901 family phage tail tape measure protein